MKFVIGSCFPPPINSKGGTNSVNLFLNLEVFDLSTFEYYLNVLVQGTEYILSPSVTAKSSPIYFAPCSIHAIILVNVFPVLGGAKTTVVSPFKLKADE